MQFHVEVRSISYQKTQKRLIHCEIRAHFLIKCFFGAKLGMNMYFHLPYYYHHIPETKPRNAPQKILE